MAEPTAITEGIRISVRVSYSPERSDPSRGQWFYLYRIRIANESEKTVQLISRYWHIEDAQPTLIRVQHSP